MTSPPHTPRGTQRDSRQHSGDTPTAAAAMCCCNALALQCGRNVEGDQLMLLSSSLKLLRVGVRSGRLAQRWRQRGLRQRALKLPAGR